MDARLGSAKRDTVGRDGGNSRNGHWAKIVLTDVGPVEIDVPRGPGCLVQLGDRGQAAAAAGEIDDLVISLVTRSAGTCSAWRGT
jgi:hypothetical protein